MKARIVTVLGLALALALPAAAQAGLPKASSTLIVPSKSLGGVALGGSSKSVIKAWGKTKECEFQCTYEGKNSGEVAVASLESSNNGATYKVWNVNIGVGLEKGTLKPNFDTPLTEFKTSKGIGLGSKAGELMKAYPAIKKSETSYFLAGPKESETIFYTTENRITSIALLSHPGG